MRNIPQLLSFSFVFTAAVLGFFGSNNAFANTLHELEKSIHSAIEDLRLRRHSIETSYDSDGNVEINGYVSSPEDKALVERQVKTVKGVKTVQNTLSVKTSANVADATPESDALRAKALQAIQKVKGLGSYEVDIQVGPNLTLAGEAENAEDKALIFEAVKKAVNPELVVDAIAIKVKPTNEQLIERVRIAFSRETDLDAADVKITARDGIVTLEGRKANHKIIDRILSIANMVDGVDEVESKLVTDY